MPLKTTGIATKHRMLIRLITEFNQTPEYERINRLFLLQKINYYIQSKPVFKEEFEWITARDETSWRAHLEAYGINPDGSFLFKGMQFAREVAKEMPVVPLKLEEKDFYPLMQERDKLLKTKVPHKTITPEEKEQYLKISYQLTLFAENDTELKQNLENQAIILGLVKEKISAIKGEIEKTYVNPNYKTEPLGVKHVNNFNFKFEMTGWDKELVWRVEDRNDLSFEQELHSYPVAKYFANDATLFMMHFKGEEREEIEYKPVILSQFANQGSLLDVAKKLQGQTQQTIASQTKFYFTQINDFCLKLKEAGAFHPDIKLSNFLIHNYKLLISDRKTFTRSRSPIVNGLRSTPRYAPPEYLACLDEECEKYLDYASTTLVDAEQLMSYQMGKALKEFLIVTQIGEIPDSTLNKLTLLEHFKTPNHAITNLSLLVDELTRFEAGKRLSIEKFQKLFSFLNHLRVQSFS